MMIVVVLPKRIEAEVALKRVPDHVNMVRIILGIVVFNNEGRACDPIVVPLTPLETASPSKENPVEAGTANLLKGPVGKLTP